MSAGLGAHLYVRDVSHVIKLRVLSDASERIRRAVEASGLSPKKAAKKLEQQRERRLLWTRELFGVDEHDASLYDVVFQLKQIQPERVIEVLRDLSGFRGFQPMTYSRRCLENLLLASQVRAELLAEFPEHFVRADGSRLVVHVRCSTRQRSQVVSRIKERVKQMAGVGLVEVHAVGSSKALYLCANDQGIPTAV